MSTPDDAHLRPSAGALTVSRWTRYGKDRLYVAAQDGQRVGWHDLVIGSATIERPEFTDAFHEAVSAFQTASGLPVAADTPPAVVQAVDGPQSAVPVTAGEPVAHAVPPALPSEPTWTDLALNRPGQAIRAEAESLVADMKAHSKVGTFLKRALDINTDERAFRVGADGEEAVGARLERLTKHGWRVLHSIPVGSRGSDIDHLVIGKGGVYPVNTKRHPGGTVWVGQHQIRVNGQPTHYLRNSRYEVERVHKTLLAHLGVEVPVRAVLVFLTGTVVPQVTIKQMPDDVLVLDRMDLPGAFKKSPERLDPEIVEQVFQVARRSTTWR